MSLPPVIAIDNGGGNCKIGMAGQAAPTKVFPNASAKPKGERGALIADLLADSKEVSQLTLRRPVDRGYLCNLELQREIWSRGIRALLRRQPGECGLLLSEPLFNFEEIRSNTQQVVFEEMGFRSFYAAPAPVFSMHRAAGLLGASSPAARTGAGVIVDAGFSFTHIVPFFKGQVLEGGVRRINLGGKLMTNYLKELVSYRSLNMMDETYLMDSVKEQLCFVSQNVKADLKAAQNLARSPHRREFVLPDGVNNLRGYVRDPAAWAEKVQAIKDAVRAAESMDEKRRLASQMEADQVLVLNNERFMVPELLFHPDDVGLHQAGVAEATVQAVTATHAALAPLLYSNVVLTGGIASCPGFRDRFTTELRALVPDDHDLNVFQPQDPALFAWEGMSVFGSSRSYSSVALTKAQYEEGGGWAAHRQYS
ncbi:ARP6 protein [Gonium pectorale]|uniref:ARP6 protein n=1 Tax=Gonium pectorale TaxID=33097 RepID=A0A150H0D9_GONPE|nr:ARP6 protein [Gonium pectorale]|eukprot:KXZ55494.1 ARP6 protein [Gonium pectorale]